MHKHPIKPAVAAVLLVAVMTVPWGRPLIPQTRINPKDTPTVTTTIFPPTRLHSRYGWK
jgi:hypothetical protein